MGSVEVLKFSPRCAPVVIRNLPSANNLYRAQKRNVQGLPFNEKRISGSNENRFPPIDNRKRTAGFSNEKLGTSEMPLLVTLAVPEKWRKVLLLSVVCEKQD